MLRVADDVFARSDTGRQRRENEDSLLARTPLFAVADGMGGAQAGEVASRLAAETFSGGLPDDGTPEQRLEVRVRDANTRIHEVSQEDRALNGMGTTLTAAYLDGDELALAHVGDSRAYLLRDGVWVEDVGSTNGTYLNGIRLTHAKRLAPGDILRVGETEMRYEA